MIDHRGFVELAEGLRWTTARLAIRRILPKDRAAQIEHEMNAEIMGFIREPLSRAETEERIRKFGGPWKAGEGEWLGLTVTERGHDDFLGLIFLRIVSFENETVEVGYRLHPGHHGKGFATEATSSLLDLLREKARVRKIVASCVAENTASWRVMEKLGMEREGCLRQHSSLGGEWRDELVYGLIFEEDS